MASNPKIDSIPLYKGWFMILDIVNCVRLEVSLKKKEGLSKVSFS